MSRCFAQFQDDRLVATDQSVPLAAQHDLPPAAGGGGRVRPVDSHPAVLDALLLARYLVHAWGEMKDRRAHEFQNDTRHTRFTRVASREIGA